MIDNSTLFIINDVMLHVNEYAHTGSLSIAGSVYESCVSPFIAHTML
eukprot:XP_001709306.1 Hypothetical protein GL50803_39195 [Giardia lamblia ATCC 50803]